MISKSPAGHSPVLLLLLLLVCPALGVEQYHTGSVVAGFSAKDQHGQPFDFKPGLRHLLVSSDMSTSKQANVKLSDLGKDFLPQRNAVFLVDIHGMPGIGRAFALPKMRKYNHRIILGDQKGLLDPFPTKSGQVTVLTLDAGARITEVQYWNAAKDPIEPLLTSKKD